MILPTYQFSSVRSSPVFTWSILLHLLSCFPFPDESQDEYYGPCSSHTAPFLISLNPLSAKLHQTFSAECDCIRFIEAILSALVYAALLTHHPNHDAAGSFEMIWQPVALLVAASD